MVAPKKDGEFWQFIYSFVLKTVDSRLTYVERSDRNNTARNVYVITRDLLAYCTQIRSLDDGVHKLTKAQRAFAELDPFNNEKTATRAHDAWLIDYRNNTAQTSLFSQYEAKPKAKKHFRSRAARHKAKGLLPSKSTKADETNELQQQTQEPGQFDRDARNGSESNVPHNDSLRPASKRKALEMHPSASTPKAAYIQSPLSASSSVVEPELRTDASSRRAQTPADEPDVATSEQYQPRQDPSPLDEEDELASTPAHVRLALGPTPQKDGAVRGIFDMLSSPTPLKTSKAASSRLSDALEEDMAEGSGSSNAPFASPTRPRTPDAAAASRNANAHQPAPATVLPANKQQAPARRKQKDFGTTNNDGESATGIDGQARPGVEEDHPYGAQRRNPHRERKPPEAFFHP